MSKLADFKKYIVWLAVSIICISSIFAVFDSPGYAEDNELSQVQDDKQVYVVPVHDTIERGLQAYMERAFEGARDEGADLIILDIATPGGTLEAAFGIKDLILEQDIPIYAFVSGRAISAGSFLAFASDELYMSPGSSIGAAEARRGEEIADEKVMSVWEREMRSVAESRDRDPDIAAAMVRRDMEIDDLVDSGRLLTLHASEAVEHGMADGEVASQQELLNKKGYQNAITQEYPMAWAERLARVLTSPAVASILLTLAMAGLIIELTTGGVGLPGAVSLLAFALFFGGHIFAGLAGYEVVLLFLLGVILLLVEAFLAGFGVFGVAGVVACAVGIVLSAENTQQGLNILIYSFLGTIIVLVVAFRYFVTSKFFDRIILSHTEAKDEGYVGTNTKYQEFEGKIGETETPLRPAGTAEIEGRRVDVVTEGGYIPANTKIEVIYVEGSRIVVKEYMKENNENKEE